MSNNFLVFNFLFFNFEQYWAISEKKKNKGVENMEFPGVMKKLQVNFPAVNLKQRGISKGDQEKIVRYFQDLGFRP